MVPRGKIIELNRYSRKGEKCKMSNVRTHCKYLTGEKEQIRIKELLKSRSQLAMVARTFDPSTQKAEVGVFESEVNLVYTMSSRIARKTP